MLGKILFFFGNNGIFYKMAQSDSRCIVVTSWDDGYFGDLKLAELLKRYNLQGTFYVPSSNRGGMGQPGLSDSEICSLAADNFEIGSHTVNHLNLAAIDIEQASREIRESKTKLSELTQKDVKSFCYPFGKYSESIVQLVRSVGYKNARTTRAFVVSKEEIRQAGFFKIGCTLHARKRPILVKKAIMKDAYLLKHPWTIPLMNKFSTWDLLAKSLFDRAYHNRGVFHLWGHSWEIEKYGDWARLEDVFSYISKKKDVTYCTVSALAEKLSKTA
jgi:peptidoglycan/xylan/chitin deacetylase (PgdA/CDA1 family)